MHNERGNIQYVDLIIFLNEGHVHVLLMIMTICPRQGNVLQRYTSLLMWPSGLGDAVTGRGGGRGVSGLLVMNYRTNVNKPVSDP